MSKEYFAKLRAKRKELGLCLSCGKHPSPCEPCKERNRLYMRNKRAGIPVEEKQKSWKTKRDYYLKYKYGIDVAQYDEMLKQSNGSCWICGSSKPKDKSISRLVVDHCHNTKKVRGVLCSACNKGLGLFEDSIDILEKAIQYLKR